MAAFGIIAQYISRCPRRGKPFGKEKLKVIGLGIEPSIRYYADRVGR